MNTNILNDLSRNILWAWYLDLEFLIDTIEKHNLDIDEIIENIKFNFWKEFAIDINYLIYESLSEIANQFINSHRELFEYESDEFEIYTNYMDSHIYFISEIVQSEFENFY